MRKEIGPDYSFFFSQDSSVEASIRGLFELTDLGRSQETAVQRPFATGSIAVPVIQKWDLNSRQYFK